MIGINPNLISYLTIPRKTVLFAVIFLLSVVVTDAYPGLACQTIEDRLTERLNSNLTLLDRLSNVSPNRPFPHDWLDLSKPLDSRSGYVVIDQREVDGIQFVTDIQRRSADRITINTRLSKNVEGTVRNVGYFKRTLVKSAEGFELVLESANLRKEGEDIGTVDSFMRVEDLDLVPGRGMPVQLYTQLMQLRFLNVKSSGLSAISSASVTNKRTLLQIATKLSPEEIVHSFRPHSQSDITNAFLGSQTHRYTETLLQNSGLGNAEYEAVVTRWDSLDALTGSSRDLDGKEPLGPAEKKLIDDLKSKYCPEDHCSNVWIPGNISFVAKIKKH